MKPLTSQPFPWVLPKLQNWVGCYLLGLFLGQGSLKNRTCIERIQSSILSRREEDWRVLLQELWCPSGWLSCCLSECLGNNWCSQRGNRYIHKETRCVIKTAPEKAKYPTTFGGTTGETWRRSTDNNVKLLACNYLDENQFIRCYLIWRKLVASWNFPAKKTQCCLPREM